MSRSIASKHEDRASVWTPDIPLNSLSVPGATLRYFYRGLAVSPRMRALRDRWKNGRATLLRLSYRTQCAFRFSKKAET
ncbi:MAG: hypothetical protein IOC35_06920, partial [Methylobacterium sp.]|nr:hypothetical protein [Methylobacterium sp.]